MIITYYYVVLNWIWIDKYKDMILIFPLLWFPDITSFEPDGCHLNVIKEN